MWRRCHHSALSPLVSLGGGKDLGHGSRGSGTTCHIGNTHVAGHNTSPPQRVLSNLLHLPTWALWRAPPAQGALACTCFQGRRIKGEKGQTHREGDRLLCPWRIALLLRRHPLFASSCGTYIMHSGGKLGRALSPMPSSLTRLMKEVYNDCRRLRLNLAHS